MTNIHEAVEAETVETVEAVEAETVETVETVNEAETVEAVAETVKITKSERLTLAAAAFNDPTVTVEAVAALMAATGKGREHLDATYNGAVTPLTLANLSDPTVLPALLAPLAERREAVGKVLDTLTPQKVSREADPIAVRSALIEKVALFAATRDHLVEAVEYVTALFNEADPGDMTADEAKIVAEMLPAEKVTTATAKIAAALHGSPRKATGNGTPHEAVPHPTVTVGQLLTNATKGKYAGCAATVDTLNAKGEPSKLTTTDGETHTSISAAAKHYTRTETDGWKFYGLKS